MHEKFLRRDLRHMLPKGPRSFNFRSKSTGSPVAAFQRRMMLSAPPVSSVRLSGMNDTDHTGSPGPTSVRASARVLRSMIATDPPMLAAAASAPSGETASEITGRGPASNVA